MFGAENARSKLSRAIQTALKMIPVANLFGAQHLKARTGFFHTSIAV